MTALSQHDQIAKVFAKLISDLKANAQADFDDLFTTNCSFNMSTLGSFKGTKAAREKFNWQGLPVNYKQFHIFNSCIRYADNHAVQTAYVIGKVGKLKNNYFHYFLFGGRYLINYSYSDKWQISTLSYLEDMEFGNTIFVDNWWKMIDYRLVDGYSNQYIIPKESPWKKVENSMTSDTEEIKDVWNKYAWGIDEWDLALTKSVLTLDVFSNIPGHPLYDRSSLLDLFLRKRKKENVMSHVGRIKKIKVEGEEAIMEVWRYEPHRMGTKFLTVSNPNSMFYTVKYLFHLNKKNNQWKAYQIDYHLGVFEDDVPPESLYL